MSEPRRLGARGVAVATLIGLALGGAALPVTWPRVVRAVYPWAGPELSGTIVSVTTADDRAEVALKRDDGGLVLIPRVPSPPPGLRPGARAFKRPDALSLQVDGAEWVALVGPVERIALVLATWLGAAAAAEVVVLLVLAAARRRGTPP